MLLLLLLLLSSSVSWFTVWLCRLSAGSESGRRCALPAGPHSMPTRCFCPA